MKSYRKSFMQNSDDGMYSYQQDMKKTDLWYEIVPEIGKTATMTMGIHFSTINTVVLVLGSGVLMHARVTSLVLSGFGYFMRT